MVAGFACLTILTHLFLRYEEVEAKEIADDAYIDIGGYISGLTFSLIVGIVGVVYNVG